MPTTYTVSNSNEFYNAMAKCNGGETILLEGGNYGKLWLTGSTKFDYDYPSTVTIASKDPDDPAVFTGADVRGAENLAFDGIEFDYTYKSSGGPDEHVFRFTNCEDIAIRNSTFDGDEAKNHSTAADGYGAGYGLLIQRSNGVTVENNEFSTFKMGMTIGDSSDVVVRGNEMSDMRMDGMRFNTIDGAVIEDNYFHDFRKSPTSGDHCDMIQFWTTNTTKPSKDIVIRDNVLDIGEGTPTQSIFMNNEQVNKGRAGTEMYYQDVLIENNTITNAHKNAIYVGHSNGLTIRNNTVLHSDGGKPDGRDSGVEIPAIIVTSASTGVSVTSNIATDLSLVPKKSGWTVSNNVQVQDQDPFKPNYYSDVFVSSTLQPKDGRHQFLARPGSVIDEANAGSSLTQGNSKWDPIQGESGNGSGDLNTTFLVQKSDVATRVFDASASTLDGGALPAGSTFTWTFGDGSTAKGAKVSHSFTEGGNYDVKLTVALPDGRTSTEGMAVKVQDATVLSLSEEGHFVAYQDGGESDLSGLPKHSADGLQLGATGVTASVSRSHVVDVVGADDMSIAFTIDADKAGTSGELFRLTGSFYCAVTSSGEVQFRLYEQDGSQAFATTKGAKANDGKEHDVVVNLADDRLQVWVDGDKLADVSATGIVGGATGFGSHNLLFGNPWNKANFSGDLSAFEITVGANDFPAKPVTDVLSSSAKAATAPATLMAVTAAAEDISPLDKPNEDQFEFVGASNLDAFAA